MSHEDDLVAELTKLGYRVTPPTDKLPPSRCSVCGAVEEDAFFAPEQFDMTDVDDGTEIADWLMQVVVQTNLGEEGHDKVVRFFCPDHQEQAIRELRSIGYVSHHHGGTSLLEDRTCPGYLYVNECPHGQHSPYDMDDNGLYIPAR